MTIGRNPHVSKALAAEQKAEHAPDEIARVRARREAAHLWDRASEREKAGKVRESYERHAAHNRTLADGPAEDLGAPCDRATSVDAWDALPGVLAADEGDDGGYVDPLSIN